MKLNKPIYSKTKRQSLTNLAIYISVITLMLSGNFTVTTVDAKTKSQSQVPLKTSDTRNDFVISEGATWRGYIFEDQTNVKLFNSNNEPLTLEIGEKIPNNTIVIVYFKNGVITEYDLIYDGQPKVLFVDPGFTTKQLDDMFPRSGFSLALGGGHIDKVGVIPEGYTIFLKDAAGMTTAQYVVAYKAVDNKTQIEKEKLDNYFEVAKKQLDSKLKSSKEALESLPKVNKYTRNIKEIDGKPDAVQVLKALGQYQSVANAFSKDKNYEGVVSTISFATKEMTKKNVDNKTVIEFIKKNLKNPDLIQIVIIDMKNQKINTKELEKYLTELKDEQSKKKIK